MKNIILLLSFLITNISTPPLIYGEKISLAKFPISTQKGIKFFKEQGVCIRQTVECRMQNLLHRRAIEK